MKKIMIDVGHGGSDPGACANGLIEKDLNLEVALKVKAFLSSYQVEVRLTRETDVTIEPDNRVKLVNDFNPDLCISIHHNSANGAARGAEVIHAAQKQTDDGLADEILKLLGAAGMPTRRSFSKLNDQGKDWYYMIRRISDNNTDAIITEGGFIDNAEDAKLLKDNLYLMREAQAIAIAAVHYLKVEQKGYKPEANEPNQEPTTAQHWGVPFIEELRKRGLINGSHDADDPITWAEFAKVIVTLLNLFDKKQ